MEATIYTTSARYIIRVFASLGLLAVAVGLAAQEINLDKTARCGELLCYQSLDEPHIYYYLPDRPRLAVRDGRPQFSFLKYARVAETEKAGIGRAAGGGIVHFLVTYGADEARVKAAEAALQEKTEKARVAGPIIYRKGSFALVTSFKEGDKTLTRTVAVGKAPLMEGQKVAVSIGLTREGAELLWESFQSATPDISLVFDMEFAGVREPYEAKLEADWSQVSKHQRVQAGLKYAWFGADVDLLFQELRQTGAVKITTKGKDAVLDKVLQSAHAKLLSVMFDPVTSKELTKAATEKDPYRNLNKAVKLLKTSARSRRSDAWAWLPPAGTLAQQAVDRPPPVGSSAFAAIDPFIRQAHATEAFNEAETLFHRRQDTSAATLLFAQADTQNKAGQKEGATAEKAYKRAIVLYRKARARNFPSDLTKKALDAYVDYRKQAKPKGDRKKVVDKRIRFLEERLAAAAGGGTAGATSGRPGATSRPPKRHRRERRTSPGGTRKKDTPGFSLVASYRMKRIKRSGKMVYEMNHFRTETQAFAMAENIGDLHQRWGRDPKVFRAVNLDDPVFRQRDVLVTLDGQDAATFGKHLNFVTVQMDKRHQSGEVTREEVVITPEQFNAKGNSFHMRYGWKGDDDRGEWLRYRARAIWSFHGDIEVRQPWNTEDTAMLALAPPHRYQAITVEGEGEPLRAAGVRHAVVTITSQVGEKPFVTRATLRNQGAAPSMVLDVPRDLEGPPPTIELIWYLHGARTVTAPSRPIEGDIVYWDELPEERP